MPILENDVKEELKRIFSDLGEKKVKIVFFKESLNCPMCPQLEELLNEIILLSDGKITLEAYNRVTDSDKAKEYAVERTPAIFIENEEVKKRVVFYGTPGGYEFVSLIEAIKNISTGKLDFDEETLNNIKKIDKDVKIKVFVTPTCPYCPSAVVIAHKFAIVNEKIRSEMIEIQEYPDLASIYNVEGVPKIVINDKVHLLGAQGVSPFLDSILKSIQN
jgi:glutaredoxin-like protein